MRLPKTLKPRKRKILDERSAQLQATQDELTRLQQDLQTRERALSQAVLAQLNRQIQDLTTQLARDQEDAELDLQAKQDELFMPVFEKVGLMLEAYADEQGFSAIFDVSNPPTGIIYYDEVVDITTEIIRRMDAAESTEAGGPGPGPGTGTGGPGGN